MYSMNTDLELSIHNLTRMWLFMIVCILALYMMGVDHFINVGDRINQTRFTCNSMQLSEYSVECCKTFIAVL